MDEHTNEISACAVVDRILKSCLPETAWQWLSSQVESLSVEPSAGTVARIFTSLPRQLKLIDSQVEAVDVLATAERLPFHVEGWPVVRLARVWLLMNIPKVAQADYVRLIEPLFMYGDMEELTALYSALPVYHYPEVWVARCKEGVRSNIGPVRHAIMVNNPYPADFLEEEAWNQLVLKAFFTEEDVSMIVGLKRRNNRQLALALTDYAYERYAAKRDINPMLWILVSSYIDERAFNLMVRVMNDGPASLERQAIAYAFKQCDYVPAQQYLRSDHTLVALGESDGTPWRGWDDEK